MKTIASMPARAAWAETELARLPVEAQARVWNPSWRAREEATATTRSLNDQDGLQVSFLIQSSRMPSRSASRSALSSGVQPTLRSTMKSSSTGRRSMYRQIERGPDSIRSRVILDWMPSWS